MFSRFLTKVLTDAPSEQGCGMSTSPSYYSGRGATTSDLNEQKLECLYKAIEKNVDAKAAKNFVRMVADIPCLSATDFLLNLERLESNKWEWSKKLLGNEKGIYVEDLGSAFGTLMTALSGQRADQTNAIRARFLDSHGIPQKGPSLYGY